MKLALRFFAAACVAFFITHARAGNLTVDLAPSQAVSAGAKWRVDGGTWRNDGATVKNLANTTHVVDFKTVSGWLTPAPVDVAISSGTTTLTATYVRPASLQVTLAPSAGQWRVDGGAWRASGVTVTGLTPANHTIEYSTLPGYAPLPAEIVTLVANQTTNVARSYTQLAAVTVALSPAHGQWRVDGGGWLASGSSATGLLPGEHLIEYLDVNGYAAPAAETITLAPGESLPLTRAYVQLAQATITLTPASAQWRIDGGGWQPSGATIANLAPGSHNIEYAAVSGYLTPSADTVALAAGEAYAHARAYVELSRVQVFLTPATGQWRVDNGAWNASGATVSNLLPGSHEISYSAVDGYLTPAPDILSLASGANDHSRVYAELARVQVWLTPGTAQWRVDGGAWQASGALVTHLNPGTHSISYSPVAGYLTPAADNLVLTSGANTHSRNYTALSGIQVWLTPEHAQWRLDEGAWQASGAVLGNLPPGQHVVSYSDVEGFATPSAETVTLLSGQTYFQSRNYIQQAQLTVSLSHPAAQWQLDGGAWQPSGSTLANLSPGEHLVSFSDVEGYTTPSPITVTLVGGANTAYGNYTQPATLTVTLDPTQAQWRLDGGAWHDSGTTVSDTIAGFHTLEFSSVQGYTTPSSQWIPLQPGTNSTAVAYQPILPTLKVVLYPTNAQYRIDGWGPHPSGSTTFFSQPGTYLIEFLPVAGFPTPDPVSVTLAWGDAEELTVYYSPPPPQKVTVNVTPSSGQWKIDGGAWNASGATVSDLALGEHVVEYAAVEGYVAPAPVTFSLALGEHRVLDAAHTLGAATLTVALTPSSARWNLDGGSWNASGASVATTSGPHTIAFEPVAGFDAPAAENIVLGVDENRSVTRHYPPAAYAVIKAFTDGGANAVFVRGSDGAVYIATRSQGSNGSGQITRVNADGTGYQVLKAYLSGPDQPVAPNSLIEGSDQKLYGTTLTGGTWGHGTLFRMNRDGTGYTVLHNFTSGSNAGPLCLIEFSDGLLYGTTSGASGTSRSMFRISKEGTGYFPFSDSRGAKDLTEGADGWIYATTDTTTFGGIWGTTFRVQKNGTGMTVLKNFNVSADGATPRSAPIFASDGVLYGTTSAGGSANKGVVYRMNPDGTNFTVVRSFLGTTSDGSRLDAKLTEGPDGFLYGATFGAGSFGRGTVFRLQKDGSGYAILRHFEGPSDGGGLGQRVQIAPDGTLFSANSFFGGDMAGTVFRMNSDGSSFAALVHLGAPDGALPVSVVEAPNGSLYGLTYNGGGARNGAIFRVNKDGTAFAVLHRFAASSDGRLPHGQLHLASDGWLYGVTVSGDTTTGTLFRIHPETGGYVTVHGFGGSSDGYLPYAGVVEASDGRLYGSTLAGGTNGGYGTLYGINKDGTGHTLLRSYANGSVEGHTPASPLNEGPDGRLYGTTSGGGSANLGTLFALNKDGTGYTILHHFGATAGDGTAPYAGVMRGADGRLYGTTNGGGEHAKGTVYAVNTDGSGYATLKHFAGGANEGTGPGYGTLAEKNGMLYGLTVLGGTFDAGTAFKLNPDGTGFVTLVNFGLDDADGRIPRGGLILGSDGTFYGTTDFGGGGGTVFRLSVD